MRTRQQLPPYGSTWSRRKLDACTSPKQQLAAGAGCVHVQRLPAVRRHGNWSRQRLDACMLPKLQLTQQKLDAFMCSSCLLQVLVALTL
ncbi:hypothetical protein [Kribbella sp. CA-293567]|uniref:hypothetical protein n=1 Tax=Kribbella sp. CA-293567 TaxID=3002436 RepID=UPI0022DE7647|nr:hypothetical protein [Kribbella sp. CA-293567]WBQ02319.1 hypothetical protein OX958_20260 [Kribbella sp. CA-293567]